MENKKLKKTSGRRKIEIKKIDKLSTLQVTFSKRRRGLFRKASELSLLCGAEVAIVVQSPAEKVFMFGHPSVEALLSRVNAPSAARIVRHADRGRRSYEEAIKMLEAEKNRIDVDGGFWWENPFEGLELNQLEEFLAALERQRDDVAERVEMLESFTINSAVAPVQELSVAASIQEFSAAPVQEFSGAAISTAASVQEFSAGAALYTAAPVQEFSAAASVQEFSGAASALDSSYLSQPFDQDKDLFDVLDSMINPDAAAAAPVQEFSDAAHSAAPVQEFSGAASASGSDSTYHSQPFDADQDFFDGLDVSYLFQPSDQDEDFHELFN